MKNQNPLRISHESLDLDDIISDLNDTQQVASQPTQKVAEESKQKKSTAAANTTGKTSQITKQPSKARFSNKENKATNANVGKAGTSKESQQDSKRDFLVSTTTDVESSVAQISSSADHQPNSNRYNESNFKFESTTHNDSQMPTQGSIPNYETSQPFYIGRSQPSAITDEDVESFQKRLDTLIVNFRSETLQEFLKTKKSLLQEQHSQIENERRRCNTLLGVKSNEIEQLKEQLGKKTKQAEELSIRSEILALWAGKGKTLARMKVLQMKAFNSLQQYCRFKKHSKIVLKNKLATFRENTKRRVFRGWEKQYKQWKIEKNKNDFEKAVKSELQHICAQYNKEIESLRDKLNEAQTIVDQENRNKQSMQENLKKAFMRGVCALNFEAMNILNPADVGYQSQVEREMEKQVLLAMNGITGGNMTQQSTSQQMQQLTQSQNPFAQPTLSQQTYDSSFQQRSPAAHMNNQGYNQFQQFSQQPKYSQAQGTDMSYSESNFSTEKKLMSIGESEVDYKKIDSKDSMWKPAPIMGREITQPVMQLPQPQITANLRSTQQQQNYVLPSHFARFNDQQYVHQATQEEAPRFERIETTTDERTVQVSNQITNSSALPDLVNQSSLPMVTSGSGQQNQGKTIYAAAELKTTKSHAATNAKGKGVTSTSTSAAAKKK